jgi:TRAP-type C4-dicarboxylate transport system substrate-binding protein
MKKVLSVLIVLVMVFGLVACGGKSQAPAAQNQPSGGSSAPAQPSGSSSAPAAPAKAHDPITIKVSCTQAATDPLTIFAGEMCDELNEKLEGSVTWELHSNGELGTLADVTEMISRGGYLVTFAGADFFSSSAPDLAVLNCQYALTDASQSAKITASDWYAEQSKLVAEKANIHLFDWNWFSGYRHMISGFPINSVNDIKGLKMRVADSQALIAFAKALDCAPIVTNWNEVYNALGQGMVDFAEAPLATLYASSLYEVSNYLAMTYNTVSIPVAIMSESIFQELTAEEQAIVTEAFHKYGEKFTEDSLTNEADYIKKFEEKGVTVTRPDVEGFKTKASSMFKDLGLESQFNTIQEIINN